MKVSKCAARTGLALGFAWGVFSSGAAAVELWQVSDLDQVGQQTIYNRTANGSLLGMPVVLADLNGDRLSDAILTPMNADSGPQRTRVAAGEIGVVLSSGTIAGITDLAALDPFDLPDDVTLIYGREPRDLFGTETAAADLNGDGYEDIIAGAQLGDGPGNSRPGAGEVVIIWGGENFGGRVIDTASSNDDVTFVYGVDPGDRLGVWVFCGDLDGDGIEDAVLGADQGEGPNNDRFHAGETYVLYGSAGLRSRREIDLADTDFPLTVVYGIDEEDHSGTTVRAGDLDGDGTDELLIGAGLNRLSASIGNEPGEFGHGSRGGDGPDNRRSNAGEAYALYLGKGVRPASIDLRDPPSTMVTIYGADPGDSYGEELFVGDFDGDGFGDIAIGAIVGDSVDNTRPNGGDLALVLGGENLPGSVTDLRFPPATGVHFFYGQARGAIAGDTAAFADVDRDGLSDLIIASPNAPVGQLARVGVTHIFFGTEETLPAEIDLASVPSDLDVVLIEGASFNDMLAYSMSSGDADNDGFEDVMLNVMDGDGIDDRLPSSGDAHVLSGRELSRLLGRGENTATPTPTATPTVALPGCAGDCDGDGEVTVSELIRAVRDLLFPASSLGCSAIDSDGNGVVSVNELVAGVNAATEGCD